ncbi:glycosyltransferase family 4 protein [Noviherbaspirillum sp.]|uniref:glycosyltransferase family 4 protein n=1 Tax=Noviherbaspirillum sp. TaxID=1926288 RepID=UPI0025EB73B9|nr:glycosyltransferase family 4 protein [Noviherbaspirillum sp.]
MKNKGQVMTVTPSAAIYFHPEAYTTTGPKLMGRNAAGESFLRGYMAYTRASEFWAQVDNIEHAQAFAQAIQGAGRSEPAKIIDRNNIAALAQVGTLYCPGPGIGLHAWHRAGLGHGAWSLCGVTHTTASAGAMDSIAELLTAPVQPWDALICTSTAVKDNVSRILQAQADYVKQRLGATRLVLPQMPVIPLGIHTSDFEFSSAQKAQARTAIAADNRTHVVMFMGRLSFHAKAHPLAMYQALEAAARAIPANEKVVLIECGWHANEYIARAYADAAQKACPSVRLITLDGRKAEERQIAWASADVFCSLSDNIQETFGIVPIEAMAAGIPVVVSDWDGYKDTVRDGIDGFRIPALMPHAGLGTDLATRHALGVDTYDMYCGHVCSLVAVDVQASTDAFVRLFTSSDLRQRMGEAGRARAKEVYDWAAIIPRYEALWTQLAEIRRAQGRDVAQLPNPWPARMDPFAAFSQYPTSILSAETRFVLARSEASRALAQWRRLAMVNFARDVLPTEAECDAVLKALEHGEKSAMELARTAPAERQAFVFRSLVWLAKLDAIRLARK